MAGMIPEDVYQLTGAADPRLSPDGVTVAYLVWGVDEKENRYRSAIWLAAVDGATPPRRFTMGAKRDAEPRWSPDGSCLAFTSDRDGDTMQLYVVPAAGGEARKLTSLDEDVTQVVWSPDGTRLAFVARVPDPAYAEKDDKRRQPRRFTRLQYKLDDVGWTGDRPRHLFTVPADGSAAPVQLTEGDFEDHSPAWSPDGETIAFVSARHPDWDLHMVSDVYLVAASAGEPRRVTQGGGSFSRLSWAPDGARLAATRYPAVWDEPRHMQVATVDAASGDVRLLTEALDRNCEPYPASREPVWDGGDILFTVEDRGMTHVYRVAADGSAAGARRRRRALRVGLRRRRRPARVHGEHGDGARRAVRRRAPSGGRRRGSRRRASPHLCRRRLLLRSRAFGARALHGGLRRRQRGRGVGHEARRL